MSDRYRVEGDSKNICPENDTLVVICPICRGWHSVGGRMDFDQLEDSDFAGEAIEYLSRGYHITNTNRDRAKAWPMCPRNHGQHNDDGFTETNPPAETAKLQSRPGCRYMAGR